MSVIVRGKTKVEWRPAFTLVLASPDGVSLSADGKLHDLTVTLTNTEDGSPVPNRTFQLATNPTGREGHGTRATTNANGIATFRVSDTSGEVVVYTASLVPNPPTSKVTITGDLTLYWSTAGFTPFFLFSCSMTTTSSGPSIGDPTSILCPAASSVDLDGQGLVGTAFPSGAIATFHTTPGGGPGDGSAKPFVGGAFGQGEAMLIATSAVPGTWSYEVTFTAPAPFTGGSSGGSPQIIVWS